ncbi:hypothetical protein TNIN_75491 [Trichonephila inaurata madagascariensis]|uniref:Uncharacterized protein n=1 Tax=Trichonephila inaurata madagascariensis TaxID=2747483 RepID=A0A8X6WX40_9ARAC|nr:hypothetical protein TNIN_75491 [Trichonephila inaurata madagascariensis]
MIVCGVPLWCLRCPEAAHEYHRWPPPRYAPAGTHNTRIIHHQDIGAQELERHANAPQTSHYPGLTRSGFVGALPTAGGRPPIPIDAPAPPPTLARKRSRARVDHPPPSLYCSTLTI